MINIGFGKRNYDNSEVVVIDLEASSLSNESYPIEAAWVSLDGEWDSFLINPDSVSGWDDWSIESESIHGIKRTELVFLGISAFDAANRLNSMLTGCLVISDYAGSDYFWLRRLFEATGVQMQFDVIDIMEIAYMSDKMAEHSTFREKKSNAEVAHRALADCQQNLDFYKELKLLGE